MTLLKFIEYQQKDTVLNKIPVELKLFWLILILLTPLFEVNPKTEVCVYLITMIIITSTLLAVYRDPAYIAEVYFAYLILFAIIYLPHILLKEQINIVRLLYIYAVAMVSIFLFSTTKVKQLEKFLKKIHVPQKIVDLLIVTWNLIPSTYRELEGIIMIKKARGMQLNGNPIKKIKNSITILIPFLLVLLIRQRHLIYALKARGI